METVVTARGKGSETEATPYRQRSRGINRSERARSYSPWDAGVTGYGPGWLQAPGVGALGERQWECLDMWSLSYVRDTAMSGLTGSRCRSLKLRARVGLEIETGLCHSVPGALQVKTNLIFPWRPF